MTTPKSYANRSKAKSRRDPYQEITNRIVGALEEGVAPWVRPWRSLGGERGAPRNASTDKTYRGLNVWLLELTRWQAGYTDCRWLTFKQARALGGCVRKGERGTALTFWKLWKKTTESTAPEIKGEMVTQNIPMLKTFHVFNVQQIDGLDLETVEIEPIPEPERNAVCEAYLASTGAEIRTGGNTAVYVPGQDFIGLPDIGQFIDAGAYYSTAFHELTHWTGAAFRVARDFSGRFGTQAYALEELVAEMGSAFLCQRHEVDGKLQHPEYVGNWIKVLKGDKRALFSAASQARKACEWTDAEIAKREGVAA